MSRCLQQEMSTLILRWDVCKTVLSMWVGACNRVCLYWFWDGTFPRQFTLYKYIGICNWVRLHWFRDGTFTRQLDLYEASATWNVYTDSKMGCLQDSLICLSSMRGNCNQKCLHRFWDGMFTRQFGPYERHLQQEMSTSILRWDVYKTVWSVREASATWTGSITEWCGVFMIRHFSRASFICTSRYLQYEMATFIPRWDLYKGVWSEQLRWAV